MSNESQLLEDILVSQVLLLADKIKANKLQKGIRTTSNCYLDAVREINQQRSAILQLVAEEYRR